jgi:hypothetical protein
MSAKYAVHPMEQRFLQSHPAHLRVPEAWRGNCPCGKWLVVLRVYTREKPLVCHGPCVSPADACGRLWFVEGEEAKFEVCTHPATIDTLPAFCARCGKEM